MVKKFFLIIVSVCVFYETALGCADVFNPGAHKNPNRERYSYAKFRSAVELFLGSRPHDFDAFLERVPTFAEFVRIREKLNKPPIQNVIFDLDGTLVAPYADIPPEVTDTTLASYKKGGIAVFIFTNSPNSLRLETLRQAGITIIESRMGKPSLEAFNEACTDYKLDPQETAMIGNFPITDMPLVRRNEAPLFSVNILVQSIPPERNKIDSMSRYLRARFFHFLNVTTARIVRIRNRSMLRDIPPEE